MKNKIRVGLCYNESTKQALLVSEKHHQKIKKVTLREIEVYQKYLMVRDTWIPRGSWDHPPLEPDPIKQLVNTAECFTIPNIYSGKLILFTRTRSEYKFDDGSIKIYELNHDPCVYIPLEFFLEKCENFPINIENLKISAPISARALADAIRDGLICEDGTLCGSFQFNIGSGNKTVRVITPFDAVPEPIY